MPWPGGRHFYSGLQALVPSPRDRTRLRAYPRTRTWPRRRPAVMHGAKASDGRCGASDERADKARRAACPKGQQSTRQGFACGCEGNGPVPSGAGGGLRITALASLERHPAFRRSARGSGLPKDLLRAASALGWDARRGDDDRVAPFLGAATRRTAQRAAALWVAAGRGIFFVGARLRASSTPTSCLREPAPARRATRKEPLGGRNPMYCSPGATRAAASYFRIGSFKPFWWTAVITSWGAGGARRRASERPKMAKAWRLARAGKPL